MDDESDVEKLRQAIGAVHAYSESVFSLALAIFDNHPNKEMVIRAFEKSNSNTEALSLYEKFSDEALANFSEAHADMLKILRASLRKP